VPGAFGAPTVGDRAAARAVTARRLPEPTVRAVTARRRLPAPAVRAGCRARTRTADL